MMNDELVSARIYSSLCIHTSAFSPVRFAALGAIGAVSR
jgi:hypothetical protein